MFSSFQPRFMRARACTTVLFDNTHIYCIILDHSDNCWVETSFCFCVRMEYLRNTSRALDICTSFFHESQNSYQSVIYLVFQKE
jgi:hypothetical protein